MKNRLFHKLLILLLALPALACGLFAADPTPTPEPTATTAPTATPAPTETPAPTPTPEPSPTPDFTADFVTYENAETGLSLQHPADWAIQDFFVLLLATDEEILDAPETLEEGAVVVVTAGDTESLGSTDPVELVNEAVEQFGLSEDVAIVDGPNPITIQGQDAAIARIEGTSDETGEGRVGLVVVIINGEWAAVGLGYTLPETEAEHLPVIEAILNTIVVSEPVETEPEAPVDAIPLAVGDLYPGTLADNGVADFVFTGQTDTPITVLVEPLDDELDLVFEIFDAEFNSLVRLDESFSGEAEETVFTPPANGEYFIRVEEFLGTAGGFEISLAAGGEQTPSASIVLIPGQLVEGSLAGEAIEYLFPATAGQPATILMLPDEELDATLTILGSDGSILVEEIDEGFSGEIEMITFTPESDGEFIVLADAFFEPEGNFSIFLIAPETVFTAEGEVAADGSQDYRVCVPANAFLVVFVEPEEDFDVVVNLHGAAGGTLTDETDTGFPGDPEAAILTEVTDANSDYPVIVSVSGFAGQGGSFSVTITSTLPDGVVIDGC
jgi:hypothetical protein